MKKSSLFMSLFLVPLLIAGCAKAGSTTAGLGQGGADKRYLVKAAMVEYELSGNQTGSKTLWFRNWGAEEATKEQTQMSVFGMTQRSNAMTILKDKSIYNINLDTNTGTKIPNPLYSKEFKGAMRGQTSSQMGLDMLKSMGGKKVGTKMIAGKSCEVWEIAEMGTQIAFYKGVPMETVANMMGVRVVAIAKSFKEGSPPGNVFEIPSNVTITEQEDPFEMLRKMRQAQQQ